MPLKETSAGTEPGSNILVASGAFPVCANCGVQCKTRANDNGAVQVGVAENPVMPWRCRDCSSVLCGRCAASRCPRCASNAGVDGLLPFVTCESCQNRSLILSNFIEGEVTYMSLAKGAAPPARCNSCRTIYCAGCATQHSGCPSCGAAEVGLFVPGYQGKNAIVTGVAWEHGRVTVAAPGTQAADRARAASEEHQGTAGAPKRTTRKVGFLRRAFGFGRGRALHAAAGRGDLESVRAILAEGAKGRFSRRGFQDTPAPSGSAWADLTR